LNDWLLSTTLSTTTLMPLQQNQNVMEEQTLTERLLLLA
jgi:hypothetical protein